MKLLKDSFRVCVFLNILFFYFEKNGKFIYLFLYGYLKYKVLFNLLY